MMTLLLKFSLAILLGNAMSESERGLVQDENGKMDYNAEINILKKQMASQLSEIRQLRQQQSNWESTRGNVMSVPERRLILDEMDYDAEITLLKQQNSKLIQQVSDLEQSKGSVMSVPERRLILDEMDYDAEITLLKQQNSKLIQQVSDLEQSKGTTYVRWGRSTCDGTGTSTVYSGYMAGAYNSIEIQGSGSDYLCLAGDPVWGHYTDKVDNAILITGVEYSFYPHQTSDIADFFGSNNLGHQAPCAVCHVDRGTSIMIPGRTTCYGNWTAEYDGYLVTGYAGYDDSTEYVCLDKRPESVIGSGAVHGKNDMFFVEAKCGYDLECPPYENGREISCVVCSK